MKKIFTLLALVALTYCEGWGQTVTIGTGTNTQVYPLDYYYGYSRSAMIYTASELGTTTTGETISSIGFYCTAAANTGPTTIYLKAVGTTTAETATTFAAKITGATTVYSGTPATGVVGWRTITLSTPFALAASQNLEVLVECNYGGTGTSPAAGNAIRYTSTTNAFASIHQDNSAPTTNLTVSNTRPNIQVTSIVVCTPPTTQATIGAYTNNTTGNSLTVNWTRGNGNNVLVVARLTSTTNVVPANGTSYTANTVFGSGNTTGVGNYVVYNGTGTSVNVTGLTASTNYTFTVYEFNTSGPCYLSPGSASAVTTSAAYCTSGLYTTGCSFSTPDEINNFTISNLSHLASGCSGGSAGYGDFTATQPVINLTQGSTYTYTITCPATGEFTGLWIDFNDNKSFVDAGEFIGSTTSASTGTTITGTVTVPAGATPGSHRLRVRLVYNTVQTLGTACTSYTYGETQDYSVNITAAVPCTTPPNQPTALMLTTPSSGTINGSFTAATGAPSGYLVFYSTSATPPSGISNGTAYTAGQVVGAYTVAAAGAATTFSVTGLTLGTPYYFYIYSYNDNCTGAPYYNTTAPLTGNATPICVTSTNTMAVTDNSTYDWNTAANWSQGHVPYPCEDAVIAASTINGTANVNLASNVSVNSLTINFTGVGGNTAAATDLLVFNTNANSLTLAGDLAVNTNNSGNGPHSVTMNVAAAGAITCNNFTSTMSGASGNNGHFIIFNNLGTFTVNGTTLNTSKETGSNANGETQINVGNSPAKYIFVGNATFDDGTSTAVGDIYLGTTAATGNTTGEMEFRGNVTYGAAAVGVAANINGKTTFNGTGTQTVTVNSTSMYLPSVAIGGTSPANSPTVVLAGTSNAIISSSSPTPISLSANNTSVLDLTTHTLNLSAAATSTLSVAAGATLRLSGTTGGAAGSNFPLNYSSYALNATSTEEYYGATQTIFSTPAYGNLTLSTSGTKTAGGALTVAGSLLINTGATYAASTFATTVTRLTTVNGTYTAGAGTQTLNGGLTVAGTFTGSTGAVTTSDVNLNSGTLTAPSGAFTVKGDWTKSGGTFANGGNTVTFAGTFQQTLTGATTFANITLTNPGGLDLEDNETVTGTFTFPASGLVSTNANALIIGAAGAIANASANAYVDGNLAWTYNATTLSHVFPVGNSGAYRPATFTYPTLTGTSIVIISDNETAFTGTVPSNVRLYTGRYYTVGATGGGTSYSLTLDGTGFNPTGTPVMLKSNGTVTSYVNTTTPNYTNATYFTTALGSATSPSIFALGQTNIPLTITGVTVNTKVYDGTTAATLNTSGAALSGVISGDNVTLNSTGATGTFNNKNAGTNKPVTTSGFTLSGSSAGYYTLTQPALTGTITPKALTASLTGNVTKPYDGTTAATLTASNFSLAGIVSGDVVTVTNTTGTYGNPNVGTGKNVTVTNLVLGGTDAANYTVSNASSVSGNIGTITARALTITANNGSKTYGQTYPTGSGSAAFTSTGLVNGETIGSVTISSTGAPATAAVGTYSIIPSAATGGTFTASNYTITYTNGTLTVNPAPLTITANDQTKCAGQAFTFNGTEFTSSGLQNGQTVGSVTLTSAGASAGAAAGTYPIVPSAATGGTFTASNYSINYTNGTFTVTALPVATISYAGNPYCSGSGTATVTRTGTAGGTYTSTPGLSINATTGTVDIGASASGTYTVTYSFSSGACSNTTTTTITINSDTWTGATNRAWDVASNWSCGVPTATTDVLIPAGLTNYPLVPGNGTTYAVRGVTIASGASLTTAAPVSNIQGILNISGAFSNSGTLSDSGKIILSGSVAQDFPGSQSAIITPMNELEVNKTTGGAVTISKSFTINTTLIPTSGIINLGTGNITLHSGQNYTAAVSAVGANASISYSDTGRFVVERFFPLAATRGYRLMTAPISTNGNNALPTPHTIYTDWQNSHVYTAGVGEFITGPADADPASGLDIYRNYSLKRYDSSAGVFMDVLRTDVPLSTADFGGTTPANVGYFNFVRGDRDPKNLNTNYKNTTTLSATGKLQTGTKIFNTPGGNNAFILVGNPYASPVNFGTLGKNNISDQFWAYDARLNGGAYVNVSAIDNPGTYVQVPTTMSAQTQHIQSSQAVFVRSEDSTQAASVTFTESDKSTTSTPLVFRPSATATSSLTTNLYLVNTDNTTDLADGTLSLYNDNYSNGVDYNDGAKFTNTNEMLAIKRDTKLLSVERRKTITSDDTLFFSLTKSKQHGYKFEFIPTGLGGNTAFLVDAYLKTSTPLDMTATSTLSFTINADAASGASDRFMIVFRPTAALPISFTNVKAYQQGSNINVEWTISNEKNMSSYEVERSTDGRTFSKSTTVAAIKNNGSAASYSWPDASPVSGANFYRIKSINKTGELQYSTIVKVTIGSGSPMIAVYPNPISGGVINLQLMNQPAGRYNIRLLDKIGQVILSKQSEHTEGSSTETLPLSRTMAHGAYQLEVTRPDGGKTNINVLY